MRYHVWCLFNFGLLHELGYIVSCLFAKKAAFSSFLEWQYTFLFMNYYILANLIYGVSPLQMIDTAGYM